MRITGASRAIPFGIAMVLALASCYSATTERADLAVLNVDQGQPNDLGIKDDGPKDVGTETGPVDVPPTDGPQWPDTNRPVGAPCTADEPGGTTSAMCAAGECLTTEYVQVLSPKVVIPGGMCTMLSCGTNTDCEPGGVCVFIANISMALCIDACTADAECREAETYKCHTGEYDDYEGTQKVRPCLPEALIILLLCDAECTQVPMPATCSVTGEPC